MPELVLDLRVGVADARVGQRQLVEEVVGGVGRVVDVDAEEGDLVAALGRDRLEVRELEPAGPAPRRPGVDDHRVAAQLRELRVERLERRPR